MHTKIFVVFIWIETDEQERVHALTSFNTLEGAQSFMATLRENGVVSYVEEISNVAK